MRERCVCKYVRKNKKIYLVLERWPHNGHRGRFTQKDRQARSKLAKLAGNKRLLCGSLVTMARDCGNPNCKCIKKGQKHVSLYLSIKDGKKRKMICIPKKWESTITQWVENYKSANKLMAEISANSIERFMKDED